MNTGRIVIALLASALAVSISLASAQERPDPAAPLAAEREVMASDFVVQRTSDGFAWEIPAGPATLRYSAVVKDGTWTEVGDHIVPGKDPVRIFEMKLRRIGDSDWPGAISPQ